MKKIGLACAVLLICSGLVGCGNNQTDNHTSRISKLRAENSSLKVKKQRIHSSSNKKAKAKRRGDSNAKSNITSASSVTKKAQQTVTSNGSSANTKTATSQNNNSQVANSRSNNVSIDGHNFHHENFYDGDKNYDILVGNNGEGELGEWAANNSTIQQDPGLRSQVEDAYAYTR